MTTHSRSHSASSKSPAIGAELIARHRKEMDALPDDQVLVPRVDVADAATTGLGALPEIEMHREALEKRFGKKAKAALDDVEPLAGLVLAANATYATAAELDLEPMAQSLRDQRDLLAGTATALIERGLVEQKSLDGLNGGSSYRSLYTDTLALVLWFQTHAAAIHPRSKVTREELQAANDAAIAFGIAVATREQTRAGTSEPARDRARAFTLFFRAYDRVRQMLSYLRWHEGDVEAIAPSLYAHGRSAKSDASATSPATSPGSTPAPTHDVPASGLPGASPFSP